MSCFHPKYSQFIRYKNSGDTKIRYNSLSSDQHIVGIPSERQRTDYIQSVTYEDDIVESSAVPLPCGKCLGCRLDKSADWAARLTCEALSRSDQDCWFVTLTYDNDHLPVNGSVMSKSEFGSELKRLRARLVRDGLLDSYRIDRPIDSQNPDLTPTFTFFVAAEYGAKFQRPHYHVIFYGLPIPDLVYNPYRGLYTSQYLSEWWKKGFISVGRVTFQSAGYVARYCLKKLTGSARLGSRLPEWNNMSRRPGIGHDYIVDNLNGVYDTDKLYLKVGDSVRSMIPPRYFDKIYELEDPVKCEQIKNWRSERAEDAIIMKTITTGKGLYDALLDDEEAKAAKIAQLRRVFEEGS